MIVEKVYSKIEDNQIKNHIATSPIWKKCYKEEELESKSGYICYTIKFDGLIPVQVTNITKFK